MTMIASAERNYKPRSTLHVVKPAVASPRRFNVARLFGPRQLLVVISLLYSLEKSYDLSIERMLALTRNKVSSQVDHTATNKNFTSTINEYAIFYHAFINVDLVDYSMGLVVDQLAEWQQSSLAKSTLYYAFVGGNSSSYSFPCPETATCRQLYRQDVGWEGDTLQKLYEYCLEKPSNKVIYLHNKGSYHDSDENHRLRRILTLSAFSDDCRLGIDSGKCDVCSARFSTFPRWHTSGNMWVSTCTHVAKLIAPNKLEAAVTTFVHQYAKQKLKWVLPSDHWVGMGRFSDEHFIHTYPRLRPCDVLTDPSFTWGYPEDEVNTTLDLQKAPRWPFEHYKRGMDSKNPYFRLEYRLSEFRYLYNEEPPVDHFIWKHYPEGNESKSISIRPLH